MHLFLSLLTPTIPALLFAVAKGECECGYTLEDTGDYYTNTVSQDFGTYADATSLNTNSPDFFAVWDVQSYSMPASGTDAPIARQNNPANIYIDDGTLVLKQSAYSAAEGAAGSPVQIAEMQSQETDFLHGSFRILAKLEVNSSAEEKGSCAGWFFYKDDTHEIDIETLTWESTTKIHYTSQPSQSDGNPIPDATNVQILSTPWTDYVEQRFDWTADMISFYENAVKNWDTTVNIPDVSGPMLMNLWSDGNSWSGTPSTSDVFWRVQQILFYYNTTSSDAGSDSTFTQACSAAGGKSSSTVCTSTNLSAAKKTRRDIHPHGRFDN